MKERETRSSHRTGMPNSTANVEAAPMGQAKAAELTKCTILTCHTKRAYVLTK